MNQLNQHFWRNSNEAYDLEFWDKSWTKNIEVILSGLLAIAAAILVFGSLFSLMPSEDYSSIPSMSLREFKIRDNRFLAEVNGSATSDPAEYFRIAAEHFEINKIALKLRNELHVTDDQVTSATLDQFADINSLQARYEVRFGHSLMMTTAQHMDRWVHAQMNSYAPEFKKINVQRSIQIFLWTYGLSLPLAGLFLMMRCKRAGLRLLPEFLNGRLIGASLGWLGIVWVYPTRINPVQQAKSVMRFCASCIAGAISFGALAGAASASESDESENVPSSGNVLTLSVLPKPTFSVMGGIMSQKVIANGSLVHVGPVVYADEHVSFSDGLSLDLFQTRVVSGTKGSDEDDYTIGKSWTTGAWSPTLHLAYYDIKPIGTSKGGDMVSPWFELSRPVKYGVSAFAVGEFYALTAGSSRQNGYDFTLGLRGSHPLGRATLSQSLSAVYVDGPFQTKVGTSVRSDSSVSILLAKKLPAIISLKLFAPISGVRGRGDNATFGFAFAKQF